MGGSLPQIGGHYYLVSDITTGSQTNVGSDDLDYEVVLDLNSKILTRNNGRAVLVYKGDKLTILDSVGGGEIRSTGSESGNGGVVLVSDGGEFTLLSGTLRKIQGETDPKYGGCIYVTGSTVNILGGEVTDGTVSLYGGNIYATGGSVLNISGGKISGGQQGTMPAISTLLPAVCVP